MQLLLVFTMMIMDMGVHVWVHVSRRKRIGAMGTWAPHSPKSLEHICSMRPSALCSISHWAQILVTEERSRGGVKGG